MEIEIAVLRNDPVGFTGSTETFPSRKQDQNVSVALTDFSLVMAKLSK